MNIQYRISFGRQDQITLYSHLIEAVEVQEIKKVTKRLRPGGVTGTQVCIPAET